MRRIISAEQGILAQEQGISSANTEIIAGQGFRYRQVGARLGQKLDRVCVGVECPRRHLVQERLPQVRQRSVDKCDLGAPTPSKGVAKPNGELEAAGPTADDDDAVFWHAEICTPVQQLRSP
jgi:hypothetical protein